MVRLTQARTAGKGAAIRRTRHSPVYRHFWTELWWRGIAAHHPVLKPLVRGVDLLGADHRVRPPLKLVLTALVALIFAALFVPSFLGQEELNIISPAEVRASEWFYYHAPRGTVLVLAAPGFPYRYGGTYSEFRGPEGDANPNLLTSAIFQSRQLGSADVPREAKKSRSTRSMDI